MANDKALQGQALFAQGHTLSEIAQHLGVSAGTVRSWKNRHGWSQQKCATERKRNVAVQHKKRNAAKIDTALVAAVEQNDELKDWEKTFCLHYSRTFNATQAYLIAKPDVCYNTAQTKGPLLPHQTHIKEELSRLRQLRNLDLMAEGEDLVLLHMQIAFADLTAYASWGTREVNSGSVDENGDPIKFSTNFIDFVDSTRIDGRLVSEVKKGRDGVGVKMVSKEKSMSFLERYFELNPADIHRREFDKRKLELQALQVEAANAGTSGALPLDDGFLKALNSDAAAGWGSENEDDSREDWVSGDELDTD